MAFEPPSSLAIWDIDVAEYPDARNRRRATSRILSRRCWSPPGGLDSRDWSADEPSSNDELELTATRLVVMGLETVAGVLSGSRARDVVVC